jgi:hypothetical protein
MASAALALAIVAMVFVGLEGIALMAIFFILGRRGSGDDEPDNQTT